MAGTQVEDSLAAVIDLALLQPEPSSGTAACLTVQTALQLGFIFNMEICPQNLCSKA